MDIFIRIVVFIAIFQTFLLKIYYFEKYLHLACGHGIHSCLSKDSSGSVHKVAFICLVGMIGDVE